MAKWWAYKHKNGEIHVKHYRSEADMDEALESDFVDDITGPFEADTVEQANEEAKKNLAASIETKTIVFRRIRAMMRKGKTDKEIADMLKAQKIEAGLTQEQENILADILDEVKHSISERVKSFIEEVSVADATSMNEEKATQMMKSWLKKNL